MKLASISAKWLSTSGPSAFSVRFAIISGFTTFLLHWEFCLYLLPLQPSADFHLFIVQHMNQTPANLEQFSVSRRTFSLRPVVRNFMNKKNRGLFPFFCLSVSVHIIFETIGPISMIHGFRIPLLNSRRNLTLILMSLLRPLFSVKCNGKFISIPQTYLGKKLLYHVESWSVALYRPISCSGRLGERPSVILEGNTDSYDTRYHPRRLYGWLRDYVPS